MKQILGVFSSDAVNLQGSRFTVGALYLSLFEECCRGVPLLVSHDASRLVGWSRPLAIFFEPGLTRLVGIGELAEDDDDFDWLKRCFACRLQAQSDYIEPEIEELRARLQGLLQGQEQPVHTECVALLEPGLASRAFVELFALQDKDGLISMKHLNPLGPGVYQIGELAVFAHSFFRRSLYRLNTLNYPLLMNLQDLDPSFVRIALDPDLVGLASAYAGGREELAYWWGPKFNDDLRSIPHGVSHHEAEETERIFFGVLATQFRWGKTKGHHVFEAEELRAVPTASSKERDYGCRYVHSMVAEKTGCVEHLDGSIRMYSESAMLERIHVDIAHAGRHTEYTKIWRIDGRISVSTWKRVLTDNFRDNFLVGEYLGAGRLDKAIWSKDQDDSLLDEYVPFSMTREMGVRLALSIHPRTEDANSPVRVVKPYDRITDGLFNHPYIETLALELKKILSRNGQTLVIPEGTRFVSFKDLYVNLPLVYHPEGEAQQSVRHTLEAIVTLINVLRARDKDWVLSYNIAFPLDKEREARISALGHVGALVEWLDDPLSCPPVIGDELHEWSEKVASLLNNATPVRIDHPRIFKVLMTSGILLINRKRIETDDFRIIHSEEDEGLEFQFTLDEGPGSVVETMLSEGIQPSVAFLIEESRCSECGQPYEKCKCSKLLDANVTQEIVRAFPFPVWTDRP